MSDVYAKIDMTNTPGSVVNTQECDSGDVFDPAFTWVIVTTMNPQPSIGWTYDGTNFADPGDTA